MREARAQSLKAGLKSSNLFLNFTREEHFLNCSGWENEAHDNIRSQM